MDINKILPSKFWLAGLLSIFIFAGCSSSENTVVIDSAPTSSGRTDTPRQQTQPSRSFQKLTIGENQKIATLDPLFAQNASSIRAIQLIYEGLVRYDENGKIIPAAARDWSVSNNEHTYRFTLRNDLFYHDSNIFNNGRGRRVVAADVKKDFERMAKANVPDKAAQFFMDIKGFEPYYAEQHHVMQATDRQLGGVSGIATPNDSTVVFSLVNPDNRFLQKLATPYAVIYPQKSVSSSSFKAVGTGPFRFSQQRSDSLYIFARFDNYHEANQPKINRVDIVTSSDEIALLNALNRGEVQLIPELSPHQVQMVHSPGGQLKNTLSGSYRLAKFREPSTYELDYNSGANASKEQVTGALQAVQGASFFSDLPPGSVQLQWALAGAASQPDSLASVYTADPIIHSFYTTLATQLDSHGIAFQMNATRVANRNTALFATQNYPGFQESQTQNSNTVLATLSVERWALINEQINNFTFSDFPWWIDLRNATIPSTNNQ